MAAILTIAAGTLGLLVALASLLLGGSLLSALLLWTSIGTAAALLGLVWARVPQPAPLRA